MVRRGGARAVAAGVMLCAVVSLTRYSDRGRSSSQSNASPLMTDTVVSSRGRQLAASEDRFLEGINISGSKCAKQDAAWFGDDSGWLELKNGTWAESPKKGVCCVPSAADVKALRIPGIRSQCQYVKAHEDGGALARGDDEPCDDVGGGHFVGLFSFGSTESYLHMYYCDLGDWHVISDVVLGLIMMLMFLLLGSTAEDFFCPALSALSELLGLQPRVAGVTLLALGNGAPDVFSIISSVKSKQAGMAVGEVTGAGNFVTTAVVGAVALVTPEGLKARGMFLRDVLMLIVATGTLLIVFIDGEVKMWEAVSFLLLYVFYVCIVIAGDRVPPMLPSERPRWREQRAQKGGGTEAEAGLAAPLNLESQSATEQSRDDRDMFLPMFGEISMSSDKFSRSEVVSKGALTGSTKYERKSKGMLPPHSGNSPLRQDWSSGTSSFAGGAMAPQLASGFARPTRSRSRSFDPRKGWTKYTVRKKLRETIGWEELEPMDKVCFVVQAPFHLARGLTIPAVIEDPEDEECLNHGFTRLQMVINPPCALPFLVNGVCGMLGWDDGTGYTVAMVLSFLLGLGCTYPAFVMTDDGKLTPSGKTLLVNAYIVLAFLNALFWINLIADDLVALLSTFGEVLQQYIDSAILGLTVLAMGNSLGDLAADLSVARGGYPNMAVTACYGGPFFNMCIGLGISFLVACSQESTGVVSKDNGRVDMRLPTTLAFSSAWLIFVLFLTLIAASAFHFHLPSKFGMAMIGAYCCFMLLAVIITLVNKADNGKISYYDELF